LEDLPVDCAAFVRMSCCGKTIHGHCKDNFFGSSLSREQKSRCPHCQVKIPSSDEKHFEHTRGWADKGKAWAQAELGARYRLGHGVEQSYEKAMEYYTLAVQNGDPNAMHQLADCMNMEKVLQNQSKKVLNIMHKQRIKDMLVHNCM
jgi:hypothetical protein